MTIEDVIAAILFVWMWIRQLATGPMSTRERGFSEGIVEEREPSGEHRADYMNRIERGEGADGANHNTNIFMRADEGEGASGGNYGEIDEDLQPQQERCDQQVPLEFGFQPRAATPVHLPEPSEPHLAYRQRTYAAHRAAILQPVFENGEENSGVSPATLPPPFEPQIIGGHGHSGTSIETDNKSFE